MKRGRGGFQAEETGVDKLKLNGVMMLKRLKEGWDCESPGQGCELQLLREVG